MSKRVIVIGAGPAGLSAAWELQKNNFEVVVLESQKFSGGRTHTYVSDEGVTMHTGAGFMMTSYTETLKLIAELGLRVEDMHDMNLDVSNDSQLHSLLRNGKLKLLTTDLVPLKDKLKILFSIPGLLKTIYASKIENINEIIKSDTESCYDFCKRRFGDDFTNNIIDPIVSALFGYGSREISKSFLFAALRETFMKKYVNTNKGIDEVWLKLSNSLNVKYENKVNNLSRLGDNSFSINTTKGNMTSDYVIVAVPGSKVSEIVTYEEEFEKAFFPKVKYKDVQIIHLKSQQKFIDTNTVIYTLKENPIITSIYRYDDKGNGGSYHYSILLRETLIDKNQTQDMKIELANKLIKEQLALEDFEIINFIEWENALPIFYPGYLKQLYEFNTNQLTKGRGLYYCGDYLSTPYIEGAVRTGLNVAKVMIDSNN